MCGRARGSSFLCVDLTVPSRRDKWRHGNLLHYTLDHVIFNEIMINYDNTYITLKEVKVWCFCINSYKIDASFSIAMCWPVYETTVATRPHSHKLPICFAYASRI